MDRRLLVLASGALVLAGAGLLARPSDAVVTATCPASVAGTLKNVSRSIVPIGVPVIRGFTVDPASDTTVSGIQLSAPPDYKPQQVSGNQAAVLRLTAPRAGSFPVQASWTVQLGDATCTASGSATLIAAAGTPVTLKPPPNRKFPGVKTTQYDTPMVWTWACTADTDATPMAATIRWEVDYRQLPLFSKGGKPPFKFTKRSKSFVVQAGDSCDARQVGVVRKTLPKGSTLLVGLGSGALQVNLRGGFRNPNGNKAPFHLGITLKQGSRTLLDRKLCAWYQSSFLVADRAGISCWW
ncbi:MAG: hypothetical protein QOK32_1500 [Gaiellaceae bacterium]|nr:hypothetical protein [Gaiellaceae bacterium]MDX6543897.1 hypothetical protein [Gaiellaceae bacterium]